MEPRPSSFVHWRIGTGLKEAGDGALLGLLMGALVLTKRALAKCKLQPPAISPMLFVSPSCTHENLD